MNPLGPKRLACLCALLGTLPCASLLRSQTPPNPAELAQFPNVISVASRSTNDFRKGDQITLTEVRSDKTRIQPGGTYLVRGTYILGSAPEATLALSLTSLAPFGKGPWQKTQHEKVEHGSGTFAFIAQMQSSGEYHVSFYLPTGPGQSSAAGGVYFDDR